MFGCGQDGEVPDEEVSQDLIETDGYNAAVEDVNANIPAEESASLDKALEELNIEECKNIENATIKETCIVNISLELADQTQDAAACDPIEDPETKDYCLEVANGANTSQVQGEGPYPGTSTETDSSQTAE